MKMLRSFLYVIALPVLLVLLWWASTLGDPNFFVPTPAQLVEAFGPTWLEGRILDDVLPSVTRLLAGLAIAIVLGIVLDGIPESVVLGISLLGGGGVAAAVVVAVFLSNIPEAIAATTGLAAGGWRPAAGGKLIS